MKDHILFPSSHIYKLNIEKNYAFIFPKTSFHISRCSHNDIIVSRALIPLSNFVQIETSNES